MSEVIQMPIVREPYEDEAMGECDWGFCDWPATVMRYDGEDWLPCCESCLARPTHEPCCKSDRGSA